MNSNTTNNLRDVWGNSSTDVFAVGLSGTIIHYNGSTWSVMTSPTTNDLWGVWGSNASDVFAVGDGGTILNFNGSEWVQMNSNSSESLRGIWGASGQDVFAVGSEFLILHYDGSAWIEMNKGQNGGMLWDIDGTNSSDVFTSGCYASIMHYDGSNWSTLDSPVLCIAGLWANNHSDVFGVGTGGGFGYWDGSAVNFIATGTSLTLWDVWGTSHDDVYMVGETGTIEHYNGSSCTGIEITSSENLYGIWGNDTGEIFVVGDNGTILRNIKPWTYMFYLAGDNDLEGWMTGIILAGMGGQYGADGYYSDANINVVAQLDRNGGYDPGSGNFTTCRRYYIAPGTIPDDGSEIEDIGEVNMGDPDTLVDFIQWTVANYPAQHYILNLVDHGSVFKMCFDFTDDDSLSINELQEALIETAPLIDIDILEFNACLMSSTEVAYEIRNYADVMVGDEASDWFLTNGEYYVIQEIKSNPDVSSLELGIILAQDQGSPYGGAWAATKTSAVDAVVSTTDSLARSLKSNWNTNPSAIKDAAQSVMTAINNSVIAINPSAIEGDHGLSIFFPKTQGEYNDISNLMNVSDPMNAYNNAFDFGRDTAWKDFLVEYYNNMSNSWIEDARATSNEWLVYLIDLYDFCENLVATCTATLTLPSTLGGTVTTPGIGNYSYVCNTSVPITAVADPCYHFINWTGSGVDAGKVANPNASSTTILMDGNYSVQANFIPTSGFYGDASGDCEIDIMDYASVRLMLFGKKAFNPGADANPDGELDIMDYASVRLMLFGKKPILAKYEVSYDFTSGNDSNKWAKSSSISAPPPALNKTFETDTGWVNATATQYNNISITDGAVWNISGASGKYAALQCKFTLVEAAANITSIGITLNGSAKTNGDILKLWAWNFSSSSWKQLGIYGSGTTNFSMTTNIATYSAWTAWGKVYSNFIDSNGYMYILANLNNASEYLYVDYIKLTVAHP